MKFLKIMAVLSVCLFASLAQAQSITTILPDSKDLKWVDVKTMPGAQIAVLMGDPTKKGPFITRIKLPANYTVAPHSHPVNEYDTVISGTWFMGDGSQVEMDKMTPLPAGSFVAIPAHSWHYGNTKEETIIQISGVGPWGMIYPKKA